MTCWILQSRHRLQQTRVWARRYCHAACPAHGTDSGYAELFELATGKCCEFHCPLPRSRHQISACSKPVLSRSSIGCSSRWWLNQTTYSSVAFLPPQRTPTPVTPRAHRLHDHLRCVLGFALLSSTCALDSACVIPAPARMTARSGLLRCFRKACITACRDFPPNCVTLIEAANTPHTTEVLACAFTD